MPLEGESVHFLNGKVYVNSEPPAEPYLLPGTHTFTYSCAKSSSSPAAVTSASPGRQPAGQRGQPFAEDGLAFLARRHPRAGRP